MDFGVVSLDHHHHNHHRHHQHNNSLHNGLGVSSSSSSEAGFASSNVISSSSSPDPETKPRTFLYGSELSSSHGNKQEKSSGSGLEDYWRSSKVAKTGSDDDFSSACKGVMFQHRNNNNNNNNNSASLMRSSSNSSNTSSTTTTTLSFLDNYNNNGGYNSHSQQHQMLSFSSSSSSSPTKSEVHALPYFSNALPASYSARSTAGYNMHQQQQQSGMMMMMRAGPFTASQWMELEHQAMIYKYITAAMPVPSNLLIPIRKAFDSAFAPSLLRSNPLGGGWGSAFHLGFSNNADPEPGRCRRTDGKKWRCSRDAVADQKYCERHMNRGRHRSRKPVEGPAAAAAALKTTNAAANAAPATSNNRMFGKEANKFGSVVTSVVDTNSLHQFIDSWPERTQLSISIPGGGETNLSPLRLSNSTGERGGGNWMSSSLGGPLGEALNLMPDGSSPTGVLQKPNAFGSLSNSSAGSSPARVDLHPSSSSSLPPPAL